MPLELRLPLLMSVVILVVLAIATAATYRTVRDFAVSRTQDRLQRGTRQLASVSSTSLGAMSARYRSVAHDPGVRRMLVEPRGPASRDGEAAARVLRTLVQPTDSGLPVELWTADGRRVALVGRDVRDSLVVAAGRPEMLEGIRDALPTPVTDSLGFGEPYAEEGKGRFWLVMPVRDGARTIGYIAHQRRLAVGAQTQRTLRELSGDSVSLFYRSRDGSLWVSDDGTVLSPRKVDNENGMATTPDGERRFLHTEPIAGTPMVIGLEVPERAVLALPWRSVRRLLQLGALLMVVGVVFAWLIGRSVARPLARLTRAAGDVAAGRYDARVPETGDHEVRRLAETFNHMAAEIGASRVALEAQTREANEANNAKSEFLTTMSHELRTPLNAIGGYADLIEMELRGPVTDAQRRDLQRIKTSQQHLLGLISSVLDLARIEAGRVSYEYVHLAIEPFLAGMEALVGPQAAAKQIELRYDLRIPELTVVADREKLRQVLLNVLSNAIRHTPPGGKITISAEPRGNRISIVLEDTGPGIPAAKREHIFEPFVQLDRSFARTRDGIGLGLAISRDLARGMHGDLLVEEPRGSGARFVLLLPAGSHEQALPMTLTGESRTSTQLPTPDASVSEWPQAR